MIKQHVNEYFVLKLKDKNFKSINKKESATFKIKLMWGEKKHLTSKKRSMYIRIRYLKYKLYKV